MTTQMITIATARPVTQRLLRPAEVAALFRVDVKTVNRWANTGRLSSIRTLGGHHRFHPADVRAALGAHA